MFEKNKKLLQTRKKITDNAQELLNMSHQNETTQNSPAQALQSNPVKFREIIE